MSYIENSNRSVHGKPRYVWFIVFHAPFMHPDAGSPMSRGRCIAGEKLSPVTVTKVTYLRFA